MNPYPMLKCLCRIWPEQDPQFQKNNFLSPFKHRFALLAIPYFTTQGKDCIHSKLSKSQIFYVFLTFLLTLIPLP